MAVKTITIDLEAYEALARRKQPGQSFSDVIKQHFHTGSTGRDLLDVLKCFAVSEDMLGEVEGQISARRRSRARTGIYSRRLPVRSSGRVGCDPNVRTDGKPPWWLRIEHYREPSRGRLVPGRSVGKRVRQSASP